MLQTWNKSGGRPWIAMILAYAFAIQAMLAASVGVQHAAAATAGSDPAVICFGMGAAPQTDDDGGARRLHHLPCALCAFADLPALAPGLTGSLATPVEIRLGPSPATQPLCLTPERMPRLSQGPPLDV